MKKTFFFYAVFCCIVCVVHVFGGSQEQALVIEHIDDHSALAMLPLVLASNPDDLLSQNVFYGGTDEIAPNDPRLFKVIPLAFRINFDGDSQSITLVNPVAMVQEFKEALEKELGKPLSQDYIDELLKGIEEFEQPAQFVNLNNKGELTQLSQALYSIGDGTVTVFYLMGKNVIKAVSYAWDIAGPYVKEFLSWARGKASEKACAG
jgi:hypothetical protein